ncbi:MAG: hypothetical protein A2X46_05640 [Lentisphaerae bacterium GWF2_57_35]|nr:MAG: hypothetical protein A2X46_05640 [Lentisphaerae bacterium GWF2_57_35]
MNHRSMELNRLENQEVPRRAVDRFGLLIFVAAGVVLGISIGQVPLTMALVLTVGLLAALLPFFRPVEALYLFFGYLVITTDASSGLSGDFFQIPDLDLFAGLPALGTTYLLIILGAVLFRRILWEREKLRISPKPLIPYLAIVILAAIIGMARGNDSELLRVDFMGALFPILCFYLCCQLLDTEQRIRRMLAIVMGVSAIKASILLVYYFNGRGWPYSLDAGSLSLSHVATMDSADLLAFITILLAIVSLWMARQLKGLRLAAAIAAALPAFLVIIFAYRRTQWVGLAASLGLMMWWAPPRGRIRLTMIGLFVVLWAICAAVFLGISDEHISFMGERTLSVFDKKQDSNEYHLLESQQVLRDLMGNPVMGLGLGGKHSPLGIYEDDVVPINIVHNTWLYIWMKIGLPGLVFFLWAAWMFLRRVLQHHPFRNRPLLLALASSSGLWLAMSLTGPTPWYQHQTFLIALFAAMTFVLTQKEGAHLDAD